MDARTANDLAALAAAAYDNGGQDVTSAVAGSETLSEGWRVLSSSELGFNGVGDTFLFDPQGYFSAIGFGGRAFVAINDETHQIVLSFRGSEPLDLTDWLISDASIAVGFLGPTLAAFFPIINAVSTYVTNQGAHGNSFELLTTGHSLGGALAELLYSTNSAWQGGAGFGSPGIGPIPYLGNHSQNFIHVTHDGDPVGARFAASHPGVSVSIDYHHAAGNTLETWLDQHSVANYVVQMSRIESSAAFYGLEFNGGLRVRFLDDTANAQSAADLSEVDVTFGGSLSDVLNGTGSYMALRIDGGGGDDFITGGNGADIVAGGSGDDHLLGGGGADSIEGGTGNDTLQGGSGGDRYSIGVYQNYDIVSDLGADGTDTIAVSTGSVFAAINYNWFSVDGNDLLVRAYDTNGVFALNIRIVGMGSTDGSIEHFDLYAGEGINLTQSWDLAQVWAQLHQPPPVDTPPPLPSPPTGGTFDFVGSLGHSVFIGTSADERAIGGAEADAFGGGAGDDILLGQGGDDVLNGGNDDDILVDDASSGALYEDYLDGGAGDDQLVFYGVPSGQDDYGDGGTGDDFALVDVHDRGSNWKLTVVGGTVHIGPSNINLEGEIRLDNIETVAVLFGTRDDTASGGGEIDYLDGGAGNDHLSGGLGDDFLLGGAGNDQLVDTSGADWIDGGSGDDIADVYLTGETRSVTFVAFDAATATGFTLVNGAHIQNVEQVNLHTGSGDDRIWLGQVYDSTETGGGNDVITTDGRGHHGVDGGSGDDRLIADFSWSTARVKSEYDAPSGHYQVYTGFSYAQATDGIGANGIESVTVTGGSNGDHLVAGPGDDIFYGGAGDDDFDAGTGVNAMYGGDGADSFSTGSGIDWIDGGVGMDLLYVGHQTSSQGLTFDGEAAASGSGFTFADGSFVKNIERVQIYSGSGDDDISLTGRGSNFLSLNSGNNSVLIDYSWATTSVSSGFDGGQSAFVAYTGNGTFGEASDNVQIYLPVSWLLLDLTIIGGSQGDTLRGYFYDDVLDGGPGDDFLDGGDGIDTARYSDATTQVTASLTTGLAGGGAGNDTLSNLENITGSAFDDVLEGGQGANTLDGGAGGDTLSGLGGDDTLIGGFDNDLLIGGADNDILNGGDGIDTASYGSATAAVTVSLATTSPQNTVGAGSDTLIGIENLTGSAFADTLTGDAGTNTLSGGGGDDTLDGGAGNDVLDGGLGFDMASYLSAGSGVTVSLALSGAQDTGGGGTDTLISIERLRGSAFADTLTGDGSDNVLNGDAGNDVLNGGDGSDVLKGGEGDDMLNGGAGIDTVSYGLATAGVTVSLNLASAQNTVGAGSDTLAAFENLTGSNFDDALEGNQGANTLVGGDGIDILSGLGGDDTLIGDAGNDLLIGGAGNDTLNGSNGIDIASYVGAASAVTVNLLTGVATGGAGSDTLSGIEKVIGSDFNDALTGDGGANRLDGGAGDDILYFGGFFTAADRAVGGIGADTLSLDGDYSGGLTVRPRCLESIETLRLAGGHSYRLSTNDSSIAAGQILTVNASALGVGDHLTFSGGHELDAAFNILGGLGSDTIVGGAGADVMLGDQGNDRLEGGGGNDMLTGGQGSDTLKGGTGADTFVFKTPSGTAPGAGVRDVILDFNHLDGDHIDLSGIDANTLVKGNQAFTLGGSAFTHTAGELIQTRGHGGIIIAGDVNGDGVPDFEIELNGKMHLVAADFFL